MKYQALFSSKDKSKNKIKVSSAAILLGSLRVQGRPPMRREMKNKMVGLLI